MSRHRGLRIVALAVSLQLLSSLPASAVPILAEVSGCLLATCTVEPLGGPVAVDPTGFTLEVDWMPEHVELFGVDASEQFLLKLDFTFTGVDDGTENFGAVTLFDETGAAIPQLNEQFDDINFGAGSFVVNYEVFNNGVDGQSFFVHGFNLALSDGSNVTTLQWVGARFSPSREGVWGHVPEPTTLALLGAGLAAVGLRRQTQRPRRRRD